ncbi:flagellar transcriptional regulator FlhD [Burkholderia sp. BCC1988]|uniref:flagellar transcriptional regulator FlhD n=1 Tax=Burkholderia sp. BCC1988 TaxID=2817443 RepID=UPI002AB26E50|nr:flagellar transcriptional regulator FlhD [Burkholderia sp. BCC1988]
MNITNTGDAVWELNMSYLWLAQRLLQEDRAKGMFRLGLTADMAAALSSLSMKHMIDLASSGQLLCIPRPGTHDVVRALMRPTPPVDIGRLHVAMTLATSRPDAGEAV